MIFQCQKNVLRGIHGDKKTWKLITCLEGKFKLLVVNNDKKQGIQKMANVYYLRIIIIKYWYLQNSVMPSSFVKEQFSIINRIQCTIVSLNLRSNGMILNTNFKWPKTERKIFQTR